MLLLDHASQLGVLGTHDFGGAGGFGARDDFGSRGRRRRRLGVDGLGDLHDRRILGAQRV